MEIPTQTAWTYDNTKGFGYHPDGTIDMSVSFGGFMNLDLKPNTKNFDNGGGKYDDNTKYIFEKYKVINYVYDPFSRSFEHNQQIIKDVCLSVFDTSTSNSVLNVIDTREARLHHIKLSYTSLKKNGIAYFKTWFGNKSGKEGKDVNQQFQHNKKINWYLKEIQEVFGNENVTLDTEREVIVAQKK